MLCALVTGASSGIGLEITRMLLRKKYRVYGIGRDFTKCEVNDNDFIKIMCDMKDTKELIVKVKEIIKEDDINLLINNAGCAYYGLHEEINADKIHEMVAVNIEAPMVLSGLLMRRFKLDQGTIVNISSICAKQSSVRACTYGATKAAMTHFSQSLFDECRKYGVKVIAIHPDLTSTELYRNADFECCNDEMYHINPEEVASAVDMAISQREGIVISDITLRPQKNSIQKKKINK